jgi:hypothetical protein
MEIPLHPLVPDIESNIDVSVIFGTYNRFASLKRCVASVRQACLGIAHEIIICDGGSTDGSLEWLREQDDIITLDGGLDGAVKAFNACFKSSSGRFILSLNDDIELDPAAVLNGLAHLKDPFVGQVAFAFGFPGQPRALLDFHGSSYLNYGLTRTGLARAIEKCSGGFWAPVYYTYGGDTELSMWVRRLGYRIADGNTSGLTDFHDDDALRARSHHVEKGRSVTIFNQRWPDKNRIESRGPMPVLGTAESRALSRLEQGELPNERWPRVAATVPKKGVMPAESEPSRERVLHVYIRTDDDPQDSMAVAFRNLGTCGHEAIDWMSMDAQTANNSFIEAARRIRPTVVFMQLQRSGVLSLESIRQVRMDPERDPGMVVVAWSGDVGEINGPWDLGGDKWSHDLSKVVDAMLYTGTGQVRMQRARGMQNASYLQIGYDESRYFPGSEKDYGTLHDVVFIGRNYGPEWSKIPTNDAEIRRDVVHLMTRGIERFRVYGGGWEASYLWQADSGDVYRKSLMAVSCSLVSNLERYSSDRLIRSMACGTTTLVKRFEDMEGLGLGHGVNCLIWDTPDEAVALARSWLSPDRRERLLEIGQAGARLMKEKHTWGQRMRELSAIVSTLRGNPRHS